MTDDDADPVVFGALRASAAALAVIIAISVMALGWSALKISEETRAFDSHGAGPVLLEALDSGWRPGPPPERRHECSMCPNCCIKCNDKFDCCCLTGDDKCPCPKDDPARPR